MLKIFSDCLCCLSNELLEKNHFSVCHPFVHIGDEAYVDGITITSDEMFSKSFENNVLPKTAAASIDEAITQFETCLNDADEVLCVCISEHVSTSKNTMCLAARELEAEGRIHIVDSEQLSVGTGILMIKAAEMLEDGHDTAAIIAEIEKLKKRVQTSFLLENPNYIVHGGRLQDIAGTNQNTMRIYPQILIKDGRIVQGKKYRGKIEKARLSFVADFKEQLLNADKKCVFITHTCVDQKNLEEVRMFIEQLNYFETIYVTPMACNIAAHFGPGALGIAFIATET